MRDSQKFNLRERVLLSGINYPTDEELIMLIIGSGNKKDDVEHLSEKILNIVDVATSENLVENLIKIPGVGKCKALAIAAAVELGRRRNCHLEAKVRSPADIIPYVQNYAIKQQEHFITVCLSGAHEILSIKVTSVGTVNRTIIHPREIFADAIKNNAAAIIVCHNHPSGNCEPSMDDIETTNKIVEASSILGIPVLDHVIINKTTYFSFLENNLLNCSKTHFEYVNKTASSSA